MNRSPRTRWVWLARAECGDGGNRTHASIPTCLTDLFRSGRGAA